MADFESVARATQAAAPGFLGLTRADAEQRATELGLRLRIVDFDELRGNGRVTLTSDLRADRLTMYIRNGVITRSDPG